MSFPTELSNILPGVTEIIAAHLNNLEAKVGIDNSEVPTSLDYLLKNPASIEPGHKHSKLWAADGSPEAVTVDSNGNVGIGTTSPGNKLEVVSGVMASDGGGATRKRLSMDVYSGYTALDAYNYGTSTGMILALNENGGNVGIGTAEPGKKLDVNGYARADGIFNTLNSAPADGDLAAGECAWWFDKTDGAAKFMIKAKQNDGTVKTASISLN